MGIEKANRLRYFAFLNTKLSSVFCVVVVALLTTNAAVKAANLEALPIIEHYRYSGHPRCPLNYFLQIFENGTVVYDGRKNVAVLGERKSQISRDAVARLKKSFQAARFFEMKTVERNPKTGRVRHDCNQDPEWLVKYGLANLCHGKDSVERFERLRAEHATEDTLVFRDGNRAKSLRLWDVSMGLDVLGELSQEVDEVAGVLKWIEPVCQVSK